MRHLKEWNMFQISLFHYATVHSLNINQKSFNKLLIQLWQSAKHHIILPYDNCKVKIKVLFIVIKISATFKNVNAFSQNSDRVLNNMVYHYTITANSKLRCFSIVLKIPVSFKGANDFNQIVPDMSILLMCPKFMF